MEYEMALKIYEKFAPFANPPTSEFPTGSIKDDSIPGAEDGTPVEADILNDYRGADDALFAEVGITPSGDVDTALSSQRLEALKLLHINDLSQAYEFETVADYKNSTISFPSGKEINIKERAAGEGGGYKGTNLPTSSVTPDDFEIVQSTAVPTQSLVKQIKFGGGLQYRTDVADERSCIDWAHYSGQGSTSPIALALHDYTDANRSLQLDKVGGTNAQYILGLRRANNDTKRPDKPTDYVGGAGYLECSFDDFSGVAGAKLVNKAFFIDDNANLNWTGKNGTADASAQFISGTPDGSGKFPFVFTATKEQDLFMKLVNSSGNVLTIRDEVAGTRTTATIDANQTSGFRLVTLAGGIDLDPANDTLIIRGDINGETGRDTTVQAVGAKMTISGDTVEMDAPMKLKQYSVVSAPDAALYTGHEVYISNGDSGNPCLAVSDGVTWRRISLGSTISA